MLFRSSARDMGKPRSRRAEIHGAPGAIRLRAALGRLLVGDGLLLTHSGDNGDKEILAVIEARLDFLADVTIGYFDIILGSTILSHEVEETIVNVDLYAERSKDEQEEKGERRGIRADIRYG